MCFDSDLPSVKHVDDVEAEIALQPHDITIRPVQYLHGWFGMNDDAFAEKIKILMKTMKIH